MARLANLLPSTWKPSIGAAYALLFDYAHLSSVRQRRCVDADRKPVPWYTYPAIDYLRQLDFSDRPGGKVILDNSDWLPESARALRESGLIQVDMTGFAPISGHTQTTSFFLHREFAFKPRGARQPLPGPGAVDKVWERPQPTEPPLVECGDDVFGAVRRDQAFAFHTRAGVRAFRLIVCRGTGDRPECAAIFDLDRDRVLLTIMEVTAGAASVEAELEATLGMTWDAFCTFVNAHPKRRYALESSGVPR